MKTILQSLGLLLLSGVAAFSGTLNVAASETPNGTLYNYSYENMLKPSG